MKILIFFCIFLLILIFRLVYLQVKNRKTFSTLREKNFLRTEVISPLRGNIIDSNGYLLASNKPIYDLYWIGKGERGLTKKQEETLSKLEHIFNIVSFKNDKIRSIIHVNRHSKKLLLKKNLEFNQLCLISEQCSDSHNIEIESRFVRIYPYKNLASHILGYLSREVENYTTKGICGLEMLFQDELKGKTGYSLNIINSKGKRINQLEFCKPKQGKNLRLTIDLSLQYIAENIFEEGQAGAFILMDPKDGALRALVSFPSFDPNAFLRPISYKEWNNKFIYNNIFLNRATSALYPPASIFKLVTFAAGLEEGIIKHDAEFVCKGFVNFHGRRYHCIRHWGHGKIDAKKALAYSCNIPCFEIAQELKINELADYAYRFGLGNKTGFLLPEKSGLIPTFEWKTATKGQRWWPGETLSAAIGQSYALVTPLQVVRMIGSICTGYLVKPRILEHDLVEISKLQITEETLEFLRKAMHGVVLHGSAKVLGRIQGIKVFAKTGTAQTSSLAIENKSKKHLEHAWLAAYFQYKKEDPLAMVVLVEHVGTSRPARKIAGKFLNSYKKMRDRF